jgi:hypothetical protein
MGKDVYLGAAAHWLRTLPAARPDLLVRDVTAAVADRDELVTAFARGPELVVYFGHGRPRGWAGYGCVRRHHLEALPAARSAGVVVALACDTLTPGRDGSSFGEWLVASGRAAAYVGAAKPIVIADGLVLQERLAARVATGRDHDVGALLDAVRVEADAPTARALACLRVQGDPQAPLPLPPVTGSRGRGDAATGSSPAGATQPGAALPIG